MKESGLSEPIRAPAWRPPLIFGMVLLVLAAVSLLDSFRLPPAGSIGIGPAVAMQIIAAILALLGVAHLALAARYRSKGESLVEAGRDYVGLAWVLGGLIAQIVMLALGVGFIISTTVLFIATACGFGKPLKSLGPVYGLLLCVAVYLFFTKALGLTLPAGPLENLLFN